MSEAGAARASIATRLVLGTAQLGQPYGISNDQDPPTEQQAGELLTYSVEVGIRTFDTAPAYGASEELLGSLLPAAGEHLVTKTPHLLADHLTREHGDEVRRSLERSLRVLRRDAVHGLLVHSADDLLKPGAEHLVTALQDVREAGLVRRIGVSVYSPAQLEAVRDQMDIDLVQVPLNVADQRFAGTRIDALRQAGVEVHARSPYLQGLLLMEPERWPEHFGPARTRLLRIQAALGRSTAERLAGCLRFVLAQPVDGVVVGAARRHELEQAIEATAESDVDVQAWAGLAIDEPRYVDPSQWPRPGT